MKQKIKDIVESMVETNSVGLKILKLESSRLDFKAEFVFLGWTKSGKLKLGDIHSSGPKLEMYKWKTKIMKFEQDEYFAKFYTNDYMYSLRIELDYPSKEAYDSREAQYQSAFENEALNYELRGN